MSTRSFIGKLNSDGSITGIYCHFDGYIEHHEPILNKHYLSEEKVDQLISLGGISILDKNIGEKQDFSNPQEGCCLAYHRDRGEVKKILKYDSVKHMLDNVVNDCGARYAYVFNDGKWDIYQRDMSWFIYQQKLVRTKFNG
jgi:hypothetical protein